MQFPYKKFEKHWDWIKALMEEALIEMAIRNAKWKDPAKFRRV